MKMKLSGRFSSFFSLTYRLIKIIQISLRPYEIPCHSFFFSKKRQIFLPTRKSIWSRHSSFDIDDEKRKWLIGISYRNVRIILSDSTSFSLSPHLVFSLSRMRACEMCDQFVISTNNDKRQLETKSNMICSRRNSLVSSLMKRKTFPICIVSRR